MRKARLVVLILTLIVPIVFLVGTVIMYRRGAAEVDQGTSPYLKRILHTRLEAWVRAQEKDVASPTDPQDTELIALMNELVEVKTERLKIDIFCSRSGAPKEHVDWCHSRVSSGDVHQVQSIVMQSEQQAKKEWLRTFLRDRIPLFFTFGTPIVGIGLLTVWVLRPDHARKRLHVAAIVTLVAWTVFIFLRLALRDFHPLLFLPELVRAIALWVAGAAVLFATLYWTRAR